MVGAKAPAMSNDDLIARVADGDITARQDLAARLRKLRWMGNYDEAKLLIAEIGNQLPKFDTHSNETRDTD